MNALMAEGVRRESSRAGSQALGKGENGVSKAVGRIGKREEERTKDGECPRPSPEGNEQGM
jgi:hypothetical protein